MAGVKNTFDKECRDLLNQEPLPTLDAVYATIRGEIVWRGIMSQASSSGVNTSEIGRGLVANYRSDNTLFRRDIEGKTHLKCTHCGGSRHTRDGCFKLIEFPEWWEEHRQWRATTKAPTSRTGGKAHMVTYGLTI